MSTRSLRMGMMFGGASLAFSALAPAQTVRYDFTEVTNLAAGAIAGQNVTTPVPGFELRLLKDGAVVYHRSFGAWSNGRVAAADSATKTLSGALIMSLVDSSPNPFSLQTRVSTYIPTFTGLKQSITIAQCFSHMSGLRNNNVAQSAPGISLQQAALDIADDTLASIPNTTFSYGGTSMHAAGAVAELAGGAPWNTLFQQRLAGPLGLTQTRYVLSGPSNPRIAGGCESTAEEFGRFMEMLRRGGLHGTTRILSPASVNVMFTRQPPLGVPIANTPLDSPYTDGADYGIGVWLDERDAQGNLLGAMAAGARGFSSWIDFDDAMAGTFATDLTISSNIQPLLYLLRAAAQNAIRNPIPCIADTDDGSGAGTPDGGITIDDLLYYLAQFDVGALRADVDDGSATGTRDGGVTIDDLLYYLLRFEQGC